MNDSNGKACEITYFCKCSLKLVLRAEMSLYVCKMDKRIGIYKECICGS